MNTFIKQVQETIVEAVKSIKNNIYRADVKLIDQQIIEDRLDDIKTASKGIEKAIKEIPLTEKIEVTNQKDVETKLEDIKKLQGNIIKAIHDIPETKQVKVTNPDDFPYPQSLEVDNLDVITNVLDKIQTVLSKLPTEYPITKIPEYPITKIPKFPESVKVSNLETLQGEDPKKYVPVRITNGKEFIEVLQNIATNFINPLRSSINRLTGRLEVDVITMPPVTVDASGLAQETTLTAIKSQTDKFTFTGANLNVVGGGGGSGGAVTIADGADIAQGAIADAAYTSGNGTVISLLKGVFGKLLASGQATMANSAPVVIASNQSAIPVTGTFWQATQPISVASLPLPTGASTSALQTTGNSSLSSIDGKIPALGQALAAASIPVVLTTAQITALTPQTNALTDTQLRATPVPISGTVSANATTPTVVKYPRGTIVVTNTAVQLGSNAVSGVIIQALSTNAASIYVGDSSVTTSNGFELQPGQATSIAIDNTNRLYINGTAGDKVCCLGS